MNFARRRYGSFLYGSPATAIDGGGRTMSVEVFRATIDNERVQELTCIAGSVDLNLDRAIKLAGTFTIREADDVEPYADYLAAWMRVTYDDGREDDYDQIGLFATKAPQGSRSPTDLVGVFAGEDLTSLLYTYAFTDADNVPAATVIREEIVDTVAAAGITRLSLPSSSEVTTAAMTFPIGTTAGEKVNILIQAAGWYQLGSDLDGRISTPGAPQALRSMQPWRTLTDADLVGGAIDVRPGGREIANVVLVINEDAKNAPLSSIARNDDPTSPTSTERIGREIVRVEKVSGKTTQARLDRLARRYLAESRSYYQVATIKTLHDPTALIPHQILELELTGEAEALNGRWWIRTARLGLTPGEPLTLEINRLTDSIAGTEV